MNWLTSGKKRLQKKSSIQQRKSQVCILVRMLKNNIIFCSFSERTLLQKSALTSGSRKMKIWDMLRWRKHITKKKTPQSQLGCTSLEESSNRWASRAMYTFSQKLLLPRGLMGENKKIYTLESSQVLMMFVMLLLQLQPFSLTETMLLVTLLVL